MPRRPVSNVKGLYKKHNRGCRNRGEPTFCDCPWYGRYKDIKKGVADWLGKPVDPRKKKHAEAVLVVFDPDVVRYEDLLQIFWESHDPTQGMRQGNDIGTQYRSGIYVTNDAQAAEAEASRETYQAALSKQGYGRITSEIQPAGPFYFAEDYHQQYLAKNPHGYCGIGGTGVSCPIGTGVSA